MARTPAIAVMIVSAAIVIAAVRLRADRCARDAAYDCARCCATATADRSANHGARASANDRAADSVLRAGSGRHRCESCHSSKGEKGLPHDILQPYGFAL